LPCRQEKKIIFDEKMRNAYHSIDWEEERDYENSEESTLQYEPGVPYMMMAEGDELRKMNPIY